ncbi:MAG: hypothetical protein WCX32_01545 [Clostridia bacterium]|jgi:hypothetical protein|nr:hypothetical protein [Clostridia bacterium]
MALKNSIKHEQNLMNSVDNYLTEHFVNSNSSLVMEKKVKGTVYYIKANSDEHESNARPEIIEEGYKLDSYFTDDLLGIVNLGDWGQFDLTNGKRNPMTATMPAYRQYDMHVYRIKKYKLEKKQIAMVSGNHDESVYKNSGMDATKFVYNEMLSDAEKGPYRTKEPHCLYAKDRCVLTLKFDDPLCQGREIPYPIELSHGDKTPRDIAQADTALNRSTARGVRLSIVADSHISYSATSKTSVIQSNGTVVTDTSMTVNPGTTQSNADWGTRMGFGASGEIANTELIRCMVIPDETGKKSKVVHDIVNERDIVNEKLVLIYETLKKYLKELENRNYNSTEEMSLTYKLFCEKIVPFVFKEAELKYIPQDLSQKNGIYNEIIFAPWSGLNIGQDDIRLAEKGYEIFKKPMKGKKKDEEEKEAIEELKVKKIEYVLKNTPSIVDIKNKIETIKKLGPNCKVLIIGDFFQTIDIAIMKNLFSNTDYCKTAFSKGDQNEKNAYIYQNLTTALADLLLPIKDNIQGFYIGLEEARSLRVDGYDLMAMIASKLGIKLFTAEEYNKLTQKDKNGSAIIDNNMDRLMTLNNYGVVNYKMRVQGTKEVDFVGARFGYSKTLGKRGSARNQIEYIPEKKVAGARINIVGTRLGDEFLAKGYQTILDKGETVTRNIATISCGNLSNPNSNLRLYRVKLRQPSKIKQNESAMYKNNQPHLQTDCLDYQTILAEQAIDNTQPIISDLIAQSQIETKTKFEEKQKDIVSQAICNETQDVIKKAMTEAKTENKDVAV